MDDDDSGGGLGDIFTAGLTSVAADSGSILSSLLGGNSTPTPTQTVAASPVASAGISGTMIAIIAGSGLLGFGVLAIAMMRN
ncbi:MAG TPA: hypothetical protein VFE58_09005 [Tepidisphaeraceae bacterium]|jgi:hypothetical protein|nr:hypothetical protein [Tepidisphaeraceae bacterium]